MAEEAPDTKESTAPDGVFGNLPATRPGTRSPRRHADAEDRTARPAAAAESAQGPAPPPPPPPPEPPAGAERETPVAAASEPRISNLEDLAWAGVAVAAQAATVGVRFASRALDAARRSVDRE
jgi:hypothetical protein